MVPLFSTDSTIGLRWNRCAWGLFWRRYHISSPWRGNSLSPRNDIESKTDIKSNGMKMMVWLFEIQLVFEMWIMITSRILWTPVFDWAFCQSQETFQWIIAISSEQSDYSSCSKSSRWTNWLIRTLSYFLSVFRDLLALVFSLFLLLFVSIAPLLTK